MHGCLLTGEAGGPRLGLAAKLSVQLGLGSKLDMTLASSSRRWKLDPIGACQ